MGPVPNNSPARDGRPDIAVFLSRATGVGHFEVSSASRMGPLLRQ